MLRQSVANKGHNETSDDGEEDARWCNEEEEGETADRRKCRDSVCS